MKFITLLLLGVFALLLSFGGSCRTEQILDCKFAKNFTFGESSIYSPEEMMGLMLSSNKALLYHKFPENCHAEIVNGGLLESSPFSVGPTSWGYDLTV